MCLFSAEFKTKNYERRTEKTYETEILQTNARVIETDNANPYISNRDNVYNRTPNFEKVEFPNKKLLDENGQIVMITLKGTNN